MSSQLLDWATVFLLGVASACAVIAIASIYCVKMAQARVRQVPIQIGDEQTLLGNYVVHSPLKIKDRVEFTDKFVGTICGKEVISDSRAMCGMSTLYMCRLDGGAYRSILMKGTEQ